MIFPVKVDLVQHQDCGDIGCADIFEGFGNNVYLVDRKTDVLGSTSREAADLPFAHLVQRRLERFDQVVRQLANEAYGIRQQKRNITKRNLTHCRIYRSEKLVLGQHTGPGKQVHQR